MTDRIQHLKDNFARWTVSYEECCTAIRELVGTGTYSTQQETPPAKGGDEAVGLIEGFHVGFGVETIKVECLKIEQIGNRVWTERIDTCIDKDGNDIIAIPILGFFEFDDAGDLVIWSDYWDMRALYALLG